MRGAAARHPFIPGLCYRPGLKVHYDLGLGAGHTWAARSGTNAPFSLGPNCLGTTGSVWNPFFPLVLPHISTDYHAHIIEKGEGIVMEIDLVTMVVMTVSKSYFLRCRERST
jgi:hypothetical protein